MLSGRGLLSDPVGMVEPAKSHFGDFPTSTGFERHEVHSQEIAGFGFSGNTFCRWFLCVTAVAEDRSLFRPSPLPSAILRDGSPQTARDDFVQQEAYDLRVREYMNSDSEFPVAYPRRMQFIPCSKDNLHDFVNLQWMCRQEFCRNRRPSAWV